MAGPWLVVLPRVPLRRVPFLGCAALFFLFLSHTNI